MLMTPCEGEPPYSVDLFLSCFPPVFQETWGPPLHLQRDGFVAGGVPAGLEMTAAGKAVE